MQSEETSTEEVLKSLSEMVATIIVLDAEGDDSDLKETVLSFGAMLVESINAILDGTNGETIN